MWKASLKTSFSNQSFIENYESLFIVVYNMLVGANVSLISLLLLKFRQSALDSKIESF